MGYSELLYAFWKENMATQNIIWYSFGRDFFRFSPKNTSIDLDDDFVFRHS